MVEYINGSREEAATALNRLAREQMKMRLLADIAVDMQVCGLEGYNIEEYVDELLKEVERIAISVRYGSEVPKWEHLCAKCGNRISVFWTECRACGARFDMDKPFYRKLRDES